MYSILWENRARKQLVRLPKKDRGNLFQAVTGLRRWPDCTGAKALKSHDYQYRLRVGRYRVFFNVENEIKIIKIEEVKKRDERTY